MSVTVSSRYRVVIPKNVREVLRLKPGTKLEMIAFDGCIECIPIQPMKKMRGSLKGMNTDIIRDRDE